MIDSCTTYMVADTSCSSYSNDSPFHPHIKYEEYPFGDNVSSEKNHGYEMVRRLFSSIGFDKEHYGSRRWNPLNKLIKPGDTVLLKPNFVTHYNWGFKSGLSDTLSLITHGSIIRAVLDYVVIALKGKGRIIVGDAPLQSADFAEVLKLTALKEIREFYRSNNLDIEIIDFRLKHAQLNKKYELTNQTDAVGYKGGYIAVDLGKDSLHNELAKDYHKMRVASYDPSEMLKHHNIDVNEYIIPKIIFEADVLINLPKLKSHIKAGLTASLKNLIGINGHKDWLPHHRKGAAEKGGDEYRSHNFFKAFYVNLEEREWKAQNKYTRTFFRQIKRIPQQIALRHSGNDGIYQGGWYGNDTIWRTTLDLNRILIYSDKEGKLTESVQKKYLSIIDGIVGGEKEGPLSPTPKPCGIMLGGYNPIATDLACACYMGFKYNKIPTINNLQQIDKYPIAKFNLKDVVLNFNGSTYTPEEFIKSKHVNPFVPGKGWQNYLEINTRKKNAI